MATKKLQIKAYTEPWIKNKLSYIANEERRSESGQIEYIVAEYIKQYEKLNGTIEFDINSDYNKSQQTAINVENYGGNNTVTGDIHVNDK